MKPVINRKVRFHYEILETLEAGIVLTGAEVKSVKKGQVDISNAYVTIKNDEIFLINASIPRYKFAPADESYDPTRSRKLLLKKSQIQSLKGYLTQKGLTLTAIKVYTKRNKVKVEIALVKGKKKFDKREDIRRRQHEKEMRNIKSF
ncbi:MAG: SsrA-binding protein SmpB [Candidatus Moranbacteria bacterium]|nr:SsrA-binding protein SmpB [Candidatus Moranbacteria bacterium]